MDTTFSPEELRTMLQATYMAVCVAEFNDRPDSRDAESMRKLAELEQKLFSMSGDFGAEQLATLDVPSGNWVPTSELEEQSFAARCLTAQENFLFWERLVADLADRDLREAGHASNWDKLSLDERDALIARAETIYWESFERDGIRHLRLSNLPAGGNN